MVPQHKRERCGSTTVPRTKLVRLHGKPQLPPQLPPLLNAFLCCFIFVAIKGTYGAPGEIRTPDLLVRSLISNVVSTSYAP